MSDTFPLIFIFPWSFRDLKNLTHPKLTIKTQVLEYDNADFLENEAIL